MNIDDLKIKTRDALNIGEFSPDAVETLVFNTIDELHAKGLLMLWNEDMDAAPEKGRYLGVIRQKSGTFGEPFICEYDEEDGHACQFWTEEVPHRPTHWMPLPPKGDA